MGASSSTQVAQVEVVLFAFVLEVISGALGGGVAGSSGRSWAVQ